MVIDFDFHPDAEKALEDLRLSILEPTARDPKYASVAELLREHIWVTLVKVALDRFPPPEFEEAVKRHQLDYQNRVEAEFRRKKGTSIEAEPVQEFVVEEYLPSATTVTGFQKAVNALRDFFIR